MALWGGRFSGESSALFKLFNDSLPVDYRLVEQDIIGSIAWANALVEVKVLTEDECQKLHLALKDLLQEVSEDPIKIIETGAEDIHSFVEQKLIEKVGDLGKKLHTGRSRNDQVATDLKLWCKKSTEQILGQLTDVRTNLLALAEREQQSVMPGYTHLQRAQPITFAHWALAYVEMIERDSSRVQDALKRLDSCPLGCGALAGTAYPMDRHKLAINLGFSQPTLNSLDSVSDRDHVIEICSAASISLMHLSRLAEDLIFFNSGEAHFIELDDQVTSGSSLMPQKKNPDALELIRGKTGRVYGSLVGILTTMKALPLAYNKDMQEDKEGLFDVMDTWSICLEMMALVLSGVKVKNSNTLAAAKQGYANATELADYLVSKGIAFREAHHIVGEVVVKAIGLNKGIEDLSLNELQAFSSLIQTDVYDILTIDSCLNKRDVLGGTAPDQVAAILKLKSSM